MRLIDADELNKKVEELAEHFTAVNIRDTQMLCMITLFQDMIEHEPTCPRPPKKERNILSYDWDDGGWFSHWNE